MGRTGYISYIRPPYYLFIGCDFESFTHARYPLGRAGKEAHSFLLSFLPSALSTFFLDPTSKFSFLIITIFPYSDKIFKFGSVLNEQSEIGVTFPDPAPDSEFKGAMDGDGTNVGVSPSFAITNAHDTHMEELSSLKQPLSGDSRDSVLAFVRFPQDNVWNRSCDGMQWQDVQIRMSYEKLMGLGSSKIRDMFSPRAQARFRRRFGSDPVPSGIDYFIDFTPPSEGPELADLTAALWLPRMVKLWFLAGQWVPDPILEAGADHGMGIPKRPLADKAVGPILSLGHDDVCKNIGCRAPNIIPVFSPLV